MKQMSEYASQYLKDGYAVIPLAGKKPRIKWEAYQFQQPTEQELQEWFATWPDAGIGLVCGTISGGRVVLDVDDVDLAERISKSELKDRTRMTRTQSGGVHIHLQETQAASRSGPLVPGVADLKANGGYVVAPPTPGYAVITDGPLLTVSDAKVWAIGLLRQYGVAVTESRDQQPAYEALKDGRIAKGARNATLTSYAGKLWQEGWTAEDIADFLSAINASKCQPPLPQEEVDGIVASISKYPRDDKQGAQVLQGFSIERKNPYAVRLKQGEFAFDVTLEGGSHHVVMFFKGKKVAEDVGALTKSRMREKLVSEAKTTEPMLPKAQLAELLLSLPEVLNEAFPVEQSASDTSDKPLWAGLCRDRLRRAIQFAKKPKLLRFLVKLLAKHGIVGEQRLAAVVYLIATSARSEDALHGVIKGDSASGKNFVTRQVLQSFPEETYLEVSELTPQSLFYLKQGELQRKCLVIAEAQGQSRANYPLRLLQSEGKLRIAVTVEDPQTGRFHTEQRELEAKVSSLTSTTKALLVHDNETRVFSLYTDGSSEQTSRIIQRHFANSAGQALRLREETIEVLRDFQRVLRPCKVVIPKDLAQAVCEELEPGFRQLVRSRRDVAQLVSLVKASAFLHQYQRRRKRVNGQRVIYADLQDYALAKELIEEFLLGTMYSLGPKSLQLIACVQSWPPTALDPSQPSYERFTVPHLRQATGWTKDEVWTWWKPVLEKTNLIDTLEEGRGRKPAVFKYLSEREASLEGLRCQLPDVKEVAQRAGILANAVQRLYRATSTSVSASDNLPLQPVMDGRPLMLAGSVNPREEKT